MISRIDRYLIGVFLGFFAAGIVIFVTLFLAVDFLGNFSEYQVSTPTLLKYYGYYLPQIFNQMFPIACLVGMVFTLTRLSKTNELVALFSSGVSLARICSPILIVIAVMSVLNFLVVDQIGPIAAKNKNYTYYVEIRKRPSLFSTIKTNKIWYRSENLLFNIQTLNPKEKMAQGLTLYYFDKDWKLVQLIQAQTVLLQEKYWELRDGLVTLFVAESSFPLTKNFDKKIVQIQEELLDLSTSSAPAEMMRLADLSRFIRKNRQGGLSTLNYEVDYHSKWAFGFASIVMALLGIPFSVVRSRSGGIFVNMGVCMGLAFLYWSIYSSFLSMARFGYIYPFIAAWAPNFLAMSVSTFFILRLNK